MFSLGVRNYFWSFLQLIDDLNTLSSVFIGPSEKENFVSMKIFRLASIKEVMYWNEVHATVIEMRKGLELNCFVQG
jgi:hypothetical protein